MKIPKLKYTKNFFEKQAWGNGLYVCGIDEVGRGCLAGPVVVSAVILPINTTYSLQDSKILSAEERDKTYKWITHNAFYTTTILSNDVIDKINIYQATLLAMKKAFFQLYEVMPIKPEFVKYLLVDAMPINIDIAYQHEHFETHYFPYGETISKSIAAASIVAKVTRDRLMVKLDQIIPGFKLNQHKGYGTKEHMDIIKQIGTSLIHRKSFLEGLKNEQHSNQQCLF